MKDRQTLRFSFVRGWASALLSRSRHKSYYTQSRPITGTRFAGPPVMGSPPSPRAARPTARFIEYNSVLCPDRLLHCHAHCYPGPRIRPGSARASSQASFTPKRRSARFVDSRVCSPQPPPTPMLAPSIPRGLRSGNGRPNIGFRSVFSALRFYPSPSQGRSTGASRGAL